MQFVICHQHVLFKMPQPLRSTGGTLQEYEGEEEETEGLITES